MLLKIRKTPTTVQSTLNHIVKIKIIVNFTVFGSWLKMVAPIYPDREDLAEELQESL